LHIAIRSVDGLKGSNGERRSLTGTGLSLRDDVTPLDNGHNGTLLNCGRLFKLYIEEVIPTKNIATNTKEKARGADDC
jgi:hypothetical protein